MVDQLIQIDWAGCINSSDIDGALMVSIDIAPIEDGDNITIASGSPDPDIPASFAVPTVWYGTFTGDVDGAGKSFRRYFWQHKITRSLYENPNEPWTEICWMPISGAPFPGDNSSGLSGGGGQITQSLYDATAASGVESLKVDIGWYNGTDSDWQYRPEDWPHGFDYRTKAHAAGLNASLYMSATYHNCDLNTVACRDRELNALQTRYPTPAHFVTVTVSVTV